MKLPFLQKTAFDSNKFLTINISSDEVKCLCLYFDEGAYKVIGSGRDSVESGSVRNGVIIDKEDVIRAIRNSVASAVENLEEKVTNVIIGISGDLCLGIMTTVRFKRNTTSEMGDTEIKDLYKRISEAANIQAQNEYLESTGNPEIELETITTSNVYLKIDGVLVDSLKGKPGSVIEAAVFNAFTPGFHIKSVQEVVKKSGLNIIALGSEMYSFCQWIKQYYKDANDFVLLSIDHQSTNAAVVFGGGIVSTKNLNIGYNHFAEGISERMGLNLKEGERLLKAYINGKMTETETNVIQASIMETGRIWLSGIELLFSEFTNVKTFAPRIYLTGYGAELKDLMGMLKSEPWIKAIPFKSFPEILKVNFSDFSKISDSTGKVSGSDWLGNICMSIIYEEIFGGTNDEN